MNEKKVLIYLICDVNVMCYKLVSYLQFNDEYNIQKGITKTNNIKIIHRIHIYVVIQIIFKINNINIKAFQSARY